ncbi:MAG: CvpA family protein [Oscillospiraceae bacterium]|nr:CvpA family protein [Oscillospiraceae bacterium]
MSGILFDLIIAAVLAFSAWQGARKGLVFTLFGLLAFVVALVGANLAAGCLAPKAAEFLEPQFARVIETALGESLAQSIPDPERILDGEHVLPGLFGAIQGTDLYEDILTGVLDSMETGISQAAGTLSGVIAKAIAQSVARSAVYMVSFAVILAVWFASAHVLDFVCGLPVLSELNTGGGILFGLFRGALIVLVAAWLFCGLLGVVPKETVEETFLLKYFANPGLVGQMFGL